MQKLSYSVKNYKNRDRYMWENFDISVFNKETNELVANAVVELPLQHGKFPSLFMSWAMPDLEMRIAQKLGFPVDLHVEVYHREEWE